MHFQGIAGLVVLIGIAWALSEKKSEVSYKGVLAGLVLQLVIALILLNVPVFKQIFLSLNRLVLSLEEATGQGLLSFSATWAAPLSHSMKKARA